MQQGGAEGRIEPRGPVQAARLRDADQVAGLFEPAPSWTTTRVSRRLAAVMLAMSLVPWLAIETAYAAELPVGLAVLAVWAALVLAITATVDLATGLGDRRVPPRHQWRLLAAVAIAGAAEWMIAVLVLAHARSTATAPRFLGGFALALVIALLVGRPLLGPRPRLLVVAARRRHDVIESAARITGRRVVRWIDPASEVLGLTLDELDDDHDYDELVLEEGCFVHLRDIPRALRHRAMYIFVIDREGTATAVRRRLAGSDLHLVGRALRRALDIGAATALLGVTMPLLTASALALHMDPHGGVLFRQTRIGRNGRRFTRYALRTTVQHGGTERPAVVRETRSGTGLPPTASLAEHPSRVRAWVQRSGIDRVPTLWNVLNGTMSLIGPPPPLPSDVEGYTAVEMRRMSVKPGVIDFRRGSEACARTVTRKDRLTRAAVTAVRRVVTSDRRDGRSGNRLGQEPIDAPRGSPWVCRRGTRAVNARTRTPVTKPASVVTLETRRGRPDPRAAPATPDNAPLEHFGRRRIDRRTETRMEHGGTLHRVRPVATTPLEGDDRPASGDVIPLVDLHAQHREVAMEVRAGFERVMERAAFISGGEVAAFEATWAAFCGTQHCLGVANGTDALELALRAAGVGPGDEVVVPATTFVATAEAVVRAGARPVVVDVDARHLLIDVAQTEAAIGPRTRAVVSVDLYGQVAPMESLEALASHAGIALIEDAAQAHGAARHGRRAGSFGVAAGMSFYPGKNLGAYGDAGVVLTDDDDIAERVRMLRNHGSVAQYQHKVLGFNSRLDTLQAVVLSAKATRLVEWNRDRRQAAARYDEMLRELSGIVLPSALPGNEHVWHLYVVRVPRRNAVLQRLRDAGIHAGVHYPSPLHLQDAFAPLGYRAGDLPVAEAAAREILSLPLFPRITVAQQERVAARLRSALRAVS